MRVEEIEEIFDKIAGVSYVKAATDGHHFELVIVATQFEAKTLVARQQWVYKYLHEYITSGKLHALQMKTYTPLEWESKNG